MQITLVHRYFWPDTPPYASLLFTIAKHLVKCGHNVQVITTQPSYELRARHLNYQPIKLPDTEIVSGVKINRFMVLSETKFSRIGKAINLIYFPLRVFLKLVSTHSADVVMCSTVPAVAMGFFTALAAKLTNTKFIYHCMDLHPEVGRISGEFKNPFLFRLLETIDSITTKMADITIVLSTDMLKTLNERKHSPKYVSILNNFALPKTGKLSQDNLTALNNSNLEKSKNKFRVIFTGNIGRFQRLDYFVLAMNLLKEIKDIELVFVGDGHALKSLKFQVDELQLQNILFIKQQNVNVARRLMSNADLGIVSLIPETYKYAFPSKMITYLEEGCPLLANVEPKSELCEIIKNNNLGYVVPDPTPEAIAMTIETAYLSREKSKSMHARCKTFVQEFYSQKKLLTKWTDVYTKLNIKP